MALLARASANAFHLTNNCFYKVSLNIVIHKFCKQLSFGHATCSQNILNLRCCSTACSSNTSSTKNFVTFDDVISQRRNQARKSILVQVASQDSSHELYDYCSQFGMVHEMHHYILTGNVHFVLIEFKSFLNIEAMSQASTHINAHQNFPVVSPIFWFRKAKREQKKNHSDPKNIPLKVTDGKHLLSTKELDNLILSGKSISDQMMILCDSVKLNDTDIRLRFISARQIESCLSGMFANIAILPFGSSVNGFGKNGCDLDLVLKMQTDTTENQHSRLVYHNKETLMDEKAQMRKVLEIMANLMHQFLPGIMNIRKILMARVPIIRYQQSLTGLECDLSMTNMTSVYISELLYIYGELDWRVKPLVFTVRMWAQCVRLTSKNPGGWITNFSLTLLVLFYLQEKLILPSLNQLVKLANKSDVRIAGTHVDCTFLRDIARLPKSFHTNKETLEELLSSFFVYYANFDFHTKAISLNEGKPLNKPQNSNMFIYNPFEQDLNVTKNMSGPETQRLIIEMRNAAWLFNTQAALKSRNRGLLLLFHQHQTKKMINTILNQSKRMVDLSSVFETNELSKKEDENDENSSLGEENRNVPKSVGILDEENRVSDMKQQNAQRHQGKR